MGSYSFLIGGSSAPSASSTGDKLNIPPALLKTRSATHVPSMANVATQSMPTNGAIHSDSEYLNTLPDPRTPSPRPRSDSENNLSNEVSMLSTKLINAINHSTSLDDNLQHTRHDLDAARKRIAELESEAQEHVDLIAQGVLLKKAEVDANMDALRAELAEAKSEREASEKGRRQMELEVENLTSALFEEANTMVANARKENEAAEKRNSQLKSRLQNTELLLASQQEQLQDLKGVMEKMSSERDETETMPHMSTAPSTPGVDTDKMSRILESLPLSPGVPTAIQPDQPLRFSHLISPVMRTDVQAYNEFAELLKTSRALTSHNRSPSATTAASSRSASGIGNVSAAASSSSPSLPGSFSVASISSPREPASPALPPLKDSKFYKRCLTEDVEPTLRLDLAPGLSWLARRTVLTAITAGSLVVEPFVANSRFYGPVYACALCGEDRRQDTYARRHRFRTSDDVSAQRYPLCEYCLGRVRATGDFTGFLRMVRDGLWRARTEEEVRSAWEESVRLREKMFWARLGGGVVPVTNRHEPIPVTGRHSDDASNVADTPDTRTSEDFDSPVIKLQSPPRTEDPFKSSSEVKRVSIGKSIIERPAAQRAESSTTVQDFASASKASPVAVDGTEAAEPVTPPMMDASEEQGESPLKQSVPGGFDG